MRMIDILEKKRDGGSLTPEEIAFFVAGITDGSIPDYQASALMMAIYFRGMNSAETALLTQEMARSGDRVNLSGCGGITVDKHSTGGVGDKTTLVVAPVAAALGCKVAKMSGRGLGHTGGTIDKLESIPGFRTTLSPKELLDQVRKIGLCVAGQSGNLAPADKKLYALRDVTATVDQVAHRGERDEQEAGGRRAVHCAGRQGGQRRLYENQAGSRSPGPRNGFDRPGSRSKGFRPDYQHGRPAGLRGG